MRITSMPARRMRAQQKSLKPFICFNDAFDGTMVLLDDVVQVFVLPDPDRCLAPALSALRAARVAPLLSTVIVSGSPFWSIAFSK